MFIHQFNYIVLSDLIRCFASADLRLKIYIYYGICYLLHSSYSNSRTNL